MAKLKKQLIEELKKWKLRAGSLFVMLVAVGMLAFGAFAFAGAGGFDWLAVEKDVANQLVEEVLSEDVEEMEEMSLSAVSSPNSPYPEWCDNFDCTSHLIGDFQDATTTIVSVATPFLMASSSNPGAPVIEWSVTNVSGWIGATTTVEMVRIDITSSTSSTMRLKCGASPLEYASSTNGGFVYNIISSDVIATSTEGVIENNITSAFNNGIGGGSVAKIVLTSVNPYLVCRMESITALGAYVPAQDAVTEDVDGKYLIRMSRSRW